MILAPLILFSILDSKLALTGEAHEQPQMQAQGRLQVQILRLKNQICIVVGKTGVTDDGV
jgi:hypothetical protein